MTMFGCYDPMDDYCPYDSEAAMYHGEVASNSSTWADPDEAQCACHGSGWFVSQLDTVHECPFHRGRCPHPEASDEELEAFAADPEAWRAAQAAARAPRAPAPAASVVEDEIDGDNIPF